MRFVKSEEERTAAARVQDDRLARDLEPPRRFEYHVLRIGPKVRAETQLNELGGRGWQLVQVIETDGHLAFYLERELPGGAEPADDDDL